MTDLERVTEAVAKAKMRLAQDLGLNNEIYRGAYVALKMLLQELHAAAKAKEKAGG